MDQVMHFKFGKWIVPGKCQSKHEK